MDSRQQFEDWAAGRGANPVRKGDNYENLEDSYAWDIWQASRESLVVELHKDFKDDTGKPFGELLTLIANAVVEDCRKAIHATGIRTK